MFSTSEMRASPHGKAVEIERADPDLLLGPAEKLATESPGLEALAAPAMNRRREK